MNRCFQLLLGAAATLAAASALAQVRLFEHDGFAGRSLTINDSVRDLSRSGFNDRASSAEVRGGRWTLCDSARFSGSCVTLRPGRYTSLSAMGLNDRVSSVRRAGGQRQRR
ncbi:MAG: beta/gamma crystallin-related protein [Caldimonas sp.]